MCPQPNAPHAAHTKLAFESVLAGNQLPLAIDATCVGHSIL